MAKLAIEALTERVKGLKTKAAEAKGKQGEGKETMLAARQSRKKLKRAERRLSKMKAWIADRAPKKKGEKTEEGETAA